MQQQDNTRQYETATRQDMTNHNQKLHDKTITTHGKTRRDRQINTRQNMAMRVNARKIKNKQYNTIRDNTRQDKT